VPRADEGQRPVHQHHLSDHAGWVDGDEGAVPAAVGWKGWMGGWGWVVGLGWVVGRLLALSEAPG